MDPQNNDPPNDGNPPTTSAAEELEQARTDLASTRAELAAARTAHLEQVRAANADIPPALITGDTPADVNASVDAARKLFTDWTALNAKNAGNGHAPGDRTPPRVPAGGATTTVDFSKMTPTEKIRRAVSQQRGAR